MQLPPTPFSSHRNTIVWHVFSQLKTCKKLYLHFRYISLYLNIAAYISKEKLSSNTHTIYLINFKISNFFLLFYVSEGTCILSRMCGKEAVLNCFFSLSCISHGGGRRSLFWDRRNEVKDRFVIRCVHDRRACSSG